MWTSWLPNTSFGVLTTCTRRIADFQQQQHCLICNKQFAYPVFTRLCNVFKCRRYHCRLLLSTWKTTSLDENLSQNRETPVHFTTPLKKGPIGCKLVMSYAKLLKLSNLISSSTDMRVTTNHTIKSKETCGNSGLNIKMRIFTMRIIHRPRRKVYHYFLSLISAENRRLISFLVLRR